LYKDKQVKIEEVAKDLGVRHVLEGSVRRAGDRLRITAQLIDDKTGQHIWADKYDRELKDIFSLQDEVTRKVVSELAVALTVGEPKRLIRKHTENFEAYDMHLRARREVATMKKENFLKTMACFTAGMYEESTLNAKTSLEKFGPNLTRDPFLIASYSMLGRMEEAKESAQQFLKTYSSFSLSSWKYGRMYKRSEDQERLYEALRKAGLS
jgi:hypothetical protein